MPLPGLSVGGRGLQSGPTCGPRPACTRPIARWLCAWSGAAPIESPKSSSGQSALPWSGSMHAQRGRGGAAPPVARSRAPPPAQPPPARRRMRTARQGLAWHTLKRPVTQRCAQSAMERFMAEPPGRPDSPHVFPPFSPCSAESGSRTWCPQSRYPSTCQPSRKAPVPRQ